MALWDAYDAHLNNIDGQTFVRGEKIPKGLYHLVCEIIVRHQDGMYLLTQRDERKNFGGMWEQLQVVQLSKAKVLWTVQSENYMKKRVFHQKISLKSVEFYTKTIRLITLSIYA